MEYFFIAAVFLFLLLIYSFSRTAGDNKKDFRYILEPELRKHDFFFVKSEFPGKFKTGPFPMTEISIAPLTTLSPVVGSRTHYRKILVKDKTGKEEEVWAKIVIRTNDACVEFYPPLDEI